MKSRPSLPSWAKPLLLAVCAASALAAVSEARAASFFPKSPFSDKAVGTAAAAFLKFPSSARAEAMGGTFAAASETSEAIFWNPAGLALGAFQVSPGSSRVTFLGRKTKASEELPPPPRSDLSLGYNALLEGAYAGSIAYARPIGAGGAVAAGLQYFSAGPVEGYSAFGDSAGSFAPNDFALSGAFAKRLAGIALGGAVKVIRSQVSDASGTTFALDLGLQARNVTDVGDSPLDAGLAIRHLGPPLSIGGASDPLPFTAQAGMLWHFNAQMRWLLDLHAPVDQDPYASLGAEYSLPISDRGSAPDRSNTARAALSLRGGYNMGNAKGVSGLAGFSAGFGLNLQKFRVDYAWVPFGDLGTLHRISLGFSF